MTVRLDLFRIGNVDFRWQSIIIIGEGYRPSVFSSQFACNIPDCLLHIAVQFCDTLHRRRCTGEAGIRCRLSLRCDLRLQLCRLIAHAVVDRRAILQRPGKPCCRICQHRLICFKEYKIMFFDSRNDILLSILCQDIFF